MYILTYESFLYHVNAVLVSSECLISPHMCSCNIVMCSVDLFWFFGSTVGEFLHILIFAKSENEYYIFCGNGKIGLKLESKNPNQMQIDLFFIFLLTKGLKCVKNS